MDIRPLLDNLAKTIAEAKVRAAELDQRAKDIAERAQAERNLASHTEQLAAQQAAEHGFSWPPAMPDPTTPIGNGIERTKAGDRK